MFKLELTSNIKKKIRELKRIGTVAMGMRNLLQVTPTPKTMIDAPAGPESYAVMFRDVCESDSTIKRFILPERRA